MARASTGSRKKVTAETLAGLGAERLAEILVDVANTRVDLKRRLRMELAAQDGPGPLTVEIDKRLTAFETSRGQITWRQRPAFIRDLDALRDLIVARLAPLDAGAALERLWRFVDTAAQSAGRYRARAGELEEVYARAAGDLGGLLTQAAPGAAAAVLVDSLTRTPAGWKAWLPELLAQAPQAVAVEALRLAAERRRGGSGWSALIRRLAEAAGDLEAMRATYSAEALESPAAAVELAGRYLEADRPEEAGEILKRAAPKAGSRSQVQEVDAAWETLWIDYLDRTRRPDEAQAVRWASFERTLSAERARAFISRLADFEDVEAEARALEIASLAPDVQQGLRFLMDWPALAEASRLIERRADQLRIDAEVAELWAAKLRRRFPQAAHKLLRSAAATAFRRRDFKACDRLTAEADSLDG